MGIADMGNPFDAALDEVIPPPPTKEQAAKTTANRAAVAISEQDTVDDQDQAAQQAERIAALQAQIDAIADGVYFDLPAEVYHAVPRLSASGLQKLCVSPATFWKGSWLDPERPELDDESTKAQVLGKAYHTARLEPQLFDSLYTRQPDKADFPRNTLFTGTDMGKALELMGLKKTGSVGEQAERLVEGGYTGPIWHVVLAEWEAERNGRTPIPGVLFDQIVADMERIRGNGEIAELLSGGEAEVSIFWTDQHGLKMKSRVDYLTAAHWADFKTFDNTRGAELEQALASAVRYNRYHVQAVTYRDAVEAIRTGGLQIMGEATDAQRTLVAAIQIRPGELACWYIFQEKGGVPNLLAYEFPFFDVDTYRRYETEALAVDEEHLENSLRLQRTATGLHRRGAADAEKAKRDFVLYSQVYDPGRPWFPIKARGVFDDALFNDYWLKGQA
jgi:hypothetical protein